MCQTNERQNETLTNEATPRQTGRDKRKDVWQAGIRRLMRRPKGAGSADTKVSE